MLGKTLGTSRANGHVVLSEYEFVWDVQKRPSDALERNSGSGGIENTHNFARMVQVNARCIPARLKLPADEVAQEKINTWVLLESFTRR